MEGRKMLRKIIGSLFFVSLMVAGWGSLDFFLDIPRFIIATGALIAPLVLSGVSRNNLSYGKERGESTFAFLVLVFLSTVGVGFFLPLFAGRKLGLLPLPEGFHYLGAAIFLSGYAIRVVAARRLKRQFSYLVTIQENHQLITSGIYSRIRHPVYLGTILAVFGMILIFPTTYGFAFAILFTAILAHRMSLEEKILLKYFGSVYQEYSSKSFRLIPHIY
jgi:protein-S-isoprenylcysteine O-methyltransferase Ste14